MIGQDNVNKIIFEHQRRLQKLKEKKAKLGIFADPSLDIEIEDIEAAITKLQGSTTATTFSSHPRTSLEYDPLISSELASTPSEPEMILIPAGEFLMGSSPKDKFAYKEERPQHVLHLPDYYLSKTPITKTLLGIVMLTTNNRDKMCKNYGIIAGNQSKADQKKKE